MTADVTAYERINSFQRLLDTPSVRLYSHEERVRRSICIDRDHFEQSVIAAACAAAHQFAIARATTARRRVDDPVGATVEILCDPHFRKQRNFGPSRHAIREKVERALQERRPVELVALMFTRKNVCPLKCAGGDGSAPDLAETLSLIQLNSFCEAIAAVYPHGARMLILGEGMRFLDAFDLERRAVQRYQGAIGAIIRDLQLQHLEYDDYERFVDRAFSKIDRQRSYRRALREYRTRILPILDAAHMSRSLTRAARTDPSNDEHSAFVPLWRSIVHSLPYTSIDRAATMIGTDRESLYRDVCRDILDARTDSALEQLRAEVLTRSWHAAIEHNARLLGDKEAGIDVAALVSPSAFRATINPKPRSSQLGIRSTRETSRRVQPWHGMSYLRMNEAGIVVPTVLSRLEIESRGAAPVRVGSMNDPVHFYADALCARALQAGRMLHFSMDPR